MISDFTVTVAAQLEAEIDAILCDASPSLRPSANLLWNKKFAYHYCHHCAVAHQTVFYYFLF